MRSALGTAGMILLVVAVCVATVQSASFARPANVAERAAIAQDPGQPDTTFHGEHDYPMPGEKMPGEDTFSADSGAAVAAQLRADSLKTATRDSLSAVARDSLRAATPDTLGAKPDSEMIGPVPAKESAAGDTLRFLPPPQNSAVGSTQPDTSAARVIPGVPAQRMGILGIHPIAILLGLGVVSYFIVKAATN